MRGVARPPKTLAQHIVDATFRSERHAILLEREDLSATSPRALRELQSRYRSTGSKRVRAAIAVEFAEAVRAPGGAGRRLTDSQAILGQVGPMQISVDEAGGVDEFFQLDAAWETWDREHGVRWRRLHGAALQQDDPAGDEATEAEWPPDPPGWDLLLLTGR